METRDRTHRRWQFNLTGLFVVLTVAAFLAAMLAGSFGVRARELLINFGTVLFVVGSGVFYYAVFLLVLCSPGLLVLGCRRAARWVMVLRQTSTGAARASQSTPDANPPSE